MTSTGYRNASGLPDPGQRTTARDMAQLAPALYHDFPGNTGTFRPANSIFAAAVRNHNHLLEGIRGPTGSKPALSTPRASISRHRRCATGIG